MPAVSHATHLWSRLRSDETGAALVWFAISLPVLVIVAAFVINYAKWFEDKRHLQTQADAAALAGGLSFSIPCDGTSDSAIATSALKYSGDTYRAAVPYNQQVSDVSSIHVVLNQTNYWQNGDANIPAQPYGDLQSACNAEFLDVKATHNAPSFFFGSLVPNGILPAIHAHARVTLVKKTVAFKTMPFAIPDIVPHYVYAQFINQVTGAALTAWSPLTQQFTTDASGNQVPVTDPTTGANIWNDVGSPISVPFAAGTPGSSVQIGVRLKVIESTNATANCGDNLVTCMDEVTANQGIVFVRGWTDDNPSTGPHPVARDVFLDNTLGGCSPDPYFTNVPCHPGIQATVDFGDRNLSDPQTTVTAVVDGISYPLVHGAGNTWTLAPGTMSVGANIGANPITLNYNWWQPTGTWRGNTCNNKKSGAGANPCQDSGSFGVVQSSYLSDDSLSARVLLAQIGDSQATPLPTTAGANSFQETSPTTNHQLTVTVGISGLQAASSFSDPTVRLRLASGSGSNTQTVDCWSQTPGSPINNIRDAIEQGCPTPYQLNPTITCPDPSAPNPPFDCAPTQTGAAVGQARQGMTTRFSCHPNNWVAPPGGGPPKIADNDPRKVELVITTWGAFNVSGTKQVAVVRFGNFYVTGWDGQSGDACAATDNNEPYPFPGSSQNGDIWGHFISHIDSSSTGGGGTQGCQLGALDACIVVLTQ
jgi:Putative Flp pilus-assembly TadE/G-like